MTATSDGQLNQVNLGAVGALVGAIQERPSAAETTWSAEVRWTGAFRSEAAVRGFAPIISDEPAALGGTDRAPNPVEQLLSSLGNCLAFLGLADGHAGFSAIRVAVHLDTDADEATVAELHRKVAATSPVGQTLSKAIPVEITHQ
jgi:uncharacterized OsmC-like protein